jgi:AcrR family transcriptional regulator
MVGRPREFDTERALDKAMQLFWRKGYEGTSLSDLTGTLGITRASLYAAFGNKEALFRTVRDRYEKKAGQYRVHALEASTAHDYARRLLDGAVALHGDRRNPPGCLGVHGALACSDDSASIREEMIARRSAGEVEIRRRLKRARAEGDLPPDCSPADFARYLSGVLYGMAILSAGGANRRELQAVADIALQQWPAGRAARS